MARINNLTNFLNDVSSAIKQKTGDSTPIPASEFDTEILSIETAGNYQEKSLTITENGNYNLLPDTGYDALSNARISVNVEGGGGTDTSDATAQMDDVFYPKTFYARGSKLTGSVILNSEGIGESLYTDVYSLPTLKSQISWSITPDEQYLVYLDDGGNINFRVISTNATTTINLAQNNLDKNWVLMNTSLINNNDEFYVCLFSLDGYIGSMKYDTFTNTVSVIQLLESGENLTGGYSTGHITRFNRVQRFILTGNNDVHGSNNRFTIIYNPETGTIINKVISNTWASHYGQLDKLDRFFTIGDNPSNNQLQKVYWFNSNLEVEATTGNLVSGTLVSFFYDNENNVFMYNPNTNKYVSVAIDATNHTITPTGDYLTPDLSGVTTSRYGNSLLTPKILSEWSAGDSTIISDMMTVSDTYTVIKQNNFVASAYALFTNQIFENGNKWYYADTTNSLLKVMGINYQGVRYTSIVAKNIRFPNTNDATAIASDIALNKTAYVNGEKITGTYYDEEYATNLALSEQILGIVGLYTELEYIESTGTQYINVGYRHNANTKVEIKFYMSSSNTRDYVGLFGARNTSWRSNAYTFFTRFNYGNFCYNRSGNEATGTGVYGNWVTLTTYGTTATYTDGTTTRNITTSGTANAGVNDWLLFNINTAGSNAVSPDSPDNSGLRIAYFKVWDDNGTTLVRDLIPVKRNSDNVVCMYDKMSGEYFTNQGTGSFTPGPEV